MRLDLDGVKKSYGKHVALRDVSLRVESARVIALIGPSGSGKSTLLRLLGGLESADGGRLEVNGREVPNREAELISYRRGNGFLFQQFNLFPHFTARRNITLPLEKVHQVEESRAGEMAETVLRRFGLLAHADKRPAEMSGGQQQRVGIARAVAAKPAVLFLDEPTSALDPEMKAEVLELIEELATQGQDIILSTHEMGFARKVADVVVFLSEGCVLETGTPERLFGAPQTADCERFLSRVMRY